MKRWFIQHAVKSLFQSKNSEGPALVAGLVMQGLVAFLPPEMITPGLEGAVSTISTTAITYAAARFYSKVRKGPEKP